MESVTESTERPTSMLSAATTLNKTALKNQNKGKRKGGSVNKQKNTKVEGANRIGRIEK